MLRKLIRSCVKLHPLRRSEWCRECNNLRFALACVKTNRNVYPLFHQELLWAFRYPNVDLKLTVLEGLFGSKTPEAALCHLLPFFVFKVPSCPGVAGASRQLAGDSSKPMRSELLKVVCDFRCVVPIIFYSIW